MESAITIIKRDGSATPLDVSKMRRVIEYACAGYPECPSLELERDSRLQFRDGMTTAEIQSTLTKCAVEKTSVQTPNWQFVGARLLAYGLYKTAAINRGYAGQFGYGSFWALLDRLTDAGIYGRYLMSAYTYDEVVQLGDYIRPERDDLLNYAGLHVLAERYLVRGAGGSIMELPQERFMVIAMHLASNESPETRVQWAKSFYDVLSRLEMTVATPTLANAGTTHPQLSSCFIDTVPDNLWGIYNTDAAFSAVSKMGGGMGIYIGHIRSSGSDIRGVGGAAGGVIPWVRNYNSTAVAVDQLGVRKGAVAIYLDVWHKDILDFLNVKTNNGDDRMKAHDIFPGVCVPDAFMAAVAARGMWNLFDPHEIRRIMGFSLEDCYDETAPDVDGQKTFTERYDACVANKTLARTEIPAIDIMKRIMTSAFETGVPFIFFRDTVNRANPNKHVGMIYCSNLCTEICNNMSEAVLVSSALNDDGTITTTTAANDFVVCNLSSLNLGRCHTSDDIKRIVTLQMRMMDNVIDLNYYPVPQAQYTNKRYRAVGLGTSGYHQWLVNRGIRWESDEHVDAADELYEYIAFCAITASMEIAREKSPYGEFAGSEWATGEFFQKRYPDGGRHDWAGLAADVSRWGMRNAWTFAIAPTATTSIISGSTSCTDPVFKRFFVDEKKDGILPQTAPNLTPETMWLYKEAHTIDQRWSIAAAGARQRHIDQAQSFNLYITPEISAPQLLALYVMAWERGLKTLYYVRNKSVETVVEDCVACSA